MYDKGSILAATDFSPRADLALERAALLAAEAGMVLHLLHVVSPLPLEVFKRLLSSTPLETEQTVLDRSRRRLDDLCRTLGDSTGAAIRPHVAVGASAPAILEHAAAHEVSLVVLGAQGEGFFQELLVGTTVARVVDGAPAPVLVVRRPGAFPYRNALVPVDFSAASAAALRATLKLVPASSVTVLHVCEIPFERHFHLWGHQEDMLQGARNQSLDEGKLKLAGFLKEVLDERADGITAQVDCGDPASVIRSHAASLGADLVAVGRHGKAGLDEVVGSVTKHVLHETACDVLVTRGAP